MTAFTPRVTGPGEGGDDAEVTPIGRKARRASHLRHVPPIAEPTFGWQQAPDAAEQQDPHEFGESTIEPRRTVTAIRHVPVDAGTVALVDAYGGEQAIDHAIDLREGYAVEEFPPTGYQINGYQADEYPQQYDERPAIVSRPRETTTPESAPVLTVPAILTAPLSAMLAPAQPMQSVPAVQPLTYPDQVQLPPVQPLTYPDQVQLPPIPVQPAAVEHPRPDPAPPQASWVDEGARRPRRTDLPLPDGPRDPDDSIAPKVLPGVRHRAVTTRAEVHRRARLVTAGATGASVLFAVLLWATAGGLADLGAPALAVTALAGLAGLLGTNLLLVQIVLMARIPMLERAFGRVALTKWHAMAGITSFGLIVLHILLSVSGTALVERFNVFEAAWRLLSTSPGVPLAAIGMAMITLVALTSRRDARTRRRYAAWHLLHLYAYLGLLLALPHQLLAGSSLTSSRLATAYWAGLFIAVAAVLVTYRVALPIFRSFRHQLVVSEVTDEAPGVVSIHLQGRQLRQLGARAGEFFHWRFLDGGRWYQAVVAPLSAVPTRSRLRITVASDDGGDRLATLAPGTWALFEGPYGSVTADVRTRVGLAFFAFGPGISPARALLEDLDYGREDAIVIYRSPDHKVVFRQELDDLAVRRGAEIVYLEGLAPESRPSWLSAQVAEQISDSAAVLHLVPDVVGRDVFVTGPEDWTEAMVAALREAGVVDSLIHVEIVTW